MKEREKQVLKAARYLVRATNAGHELAPVVSGFVRVTSFLPVSKLQYWESVFRYEIEIESWVKSNFFFTRRAPVQLSWLDYCNGDGHQRERILCTSYEGAPNGFLFAIVLRRLNDWVPQVRAAARENVPKIAANTNPEFVLEALWAILPDLHTWKRLQAEDIEVLISLLALDGVPSQLVSKLMTVTAGPAAVILGQAGRQPILDDCLAAIAQEAIQPAVRAKAYRSQLEEQIVWLEDRKWVWTDRRWCQGRYEPVLGVRKIRVDYPFLETLEKAARDSSPAVRRVAGDVLIARLNSLGAEATPIGKILASDAYPSIADRGKFVLKQVEA